MRIRDWSSDVCSSDLRHLASLTYFDNAIEQAKRFAEPELRYDPLTRKTALVSHEPVGVVAAIIPFNGPFAMGVAKTAGALLAGCSVILQPSPEGALQVEVLGSGGQTSDLQQQMRI